jgi:hypothetical protein
MRFMLCIHLLICAIIRKTSTLTHPVIESCSNPGGIPEIKAQTVGEKGCVGYVSGSASLYGMNFEGMPVSEMK